MLNALTPISTIIVGALFFRSAVHWKKLLGVLLGFTGSALCLYFKAKGDIRLDYLSYVSLIVLATLLYGANVNMVGKFLRDVGSLRIASVSFAFLLVPSFLILWYTGYFEKDLTSAINIRATAASVAMGIFGTALATVLFYMLLKKAGVFFSSLVTYGIPFVALLLGVLSNEYITWPQWASLGIILSGVYLANKE
jgi:drug/metabolite transporter (DMT)-like permease